MKIEFDQLKSVVQTICVLSMVAGSSGIHAAPSSDEAIFDPILEVDLRHDGQRASREHKHLMIMFVKDGCSPCLQMKRDVLPDPDIQAFFRQRFIAYNINIFGDLPIVDGDGAEFTEKRYAKRENIWGTPTFYFYGKNGQVVFKHTGALSKEKFLALGEFVASKEYLRQRRFKAPGTTKKTSIIE
ncbi:MAG: thioredoxin fold domain-containing protein [Gammaproteobacteria bacterium]|nr:thioredoxin fold domain-containing protein [Gammaproteobacteria bacterium]